MAVSTSGYYDILIEEKVGEGRSSPDVILSVWRSRQLRCFIRNICSTGAKIGPRTTTARRSHNDEMDGVVSRKGGREGSGEDLDQRRYTRVHSFLPHTMNALNSLAETICRTTDTLAIRLYGIAVQGEWDLKLHEASSS